ncbi:MAG: tol-pal system-associated acyl-CoA thioesterase [Betaproteobacteria bacterium]|nr:tol-pal system-associated acyl-CoA thioesterase [Betaproteobacteria bacterium]
MSAVFAWPQRVYYQHTDAGGVVFHAHYLNFMENARTELLQSLGFDPGVLLREHQVFFVVHSATLAFRRPALLNDMLAVTAEVKRATRARLVFGQQVRRGDEVLVEAEITIACTDPQAHKPIPVPAAIFRRFEQQNTGAPAAEPAMQVAEKEPIR